MTIEAAMTGEVDRTRPHAELDGTDVDSRLSRYREWMIVPSVMTKHPLVDEGSYFTTNNAQTGLATAAAPTAFSATNPFLVIYNGSNPSDDFAQRIYLDYMMLMCTAAGTAGTSVQIAITKDRGNRYTSGGTDLTAAITPTGPTSIASTTRIWGGNITASAASTNVKTLVGNRTLKVMTAPAPTVGDQYTLRSGAGNMAENINYSNNGTTVTQISQITQSIPPMVVGPDESLLVHLWIVTQSAASSYAPEIGWWER